MLIGEISHSIDAKGRYIVPSKFRDDLGERFIITKGFEHCLFVYTFEGWQRAAGNMRQLSTTDAEARKFSRNFFSGAFEAEIDKQYRVVLPLNLREHANLDKDV
ncbi:MAG: division/cell wall cluster transcriptional repressor MraZ, partial [Clostridiales bacterium]